MKVIPDHFKMRLTNDFLVLVVLFAVSMFIDLLNLREITLKYHSAMLKVPKASLLFLGLFLQAFMLQAQKDSLNNSPKEEKPEREKFGDEIFAGVSHVYGFRTLEVREGLFAQELGIRADEQALWTTSFELGYRVKMSKRMQLEFGMEYNQIGMQYRTPNDTSFVGYNRKKQGFAAPIRAVFQPFVIGTGEDFMLHVGAGFAPRMFTASRYTAINLNDFGQEEETTTKQTDGYNYFNVDALLNVGFRWNFSHSIGLYFIPEFRYGLLDTYSKQRPYIQHNYGLFLRWGVHWIL